MKNCLIGCVCLWLLLLASCSKEDNYDKNLPPLQLQVHRTELAMRKAGHTLRLTEQQVFNSAFTADKGFYQELVLGDTTAPDSLLVQALVQFSRDSSTQVLLDSVLKVYPANFPFDSLLQKPFQRLKKEFPAYPIRPIYTYITGYSRQGQQTMDPSFLSQHYCGLGLHYFLGENFPFYPPDIPRFVRRRFTPAYISRQLMLDVAHELQPGLVARSRPTLVDNMVHAGIRLYFLQRMLPHVPDSIRLAYTGAELATLQAQLPALYNSLLPLLFSQDYLKYERYTSDRPFTPGLQAGLPGRSAHYLGWQVVQAYMRQHPELTLRALMARRDYASIFKDAGYKP